jgi:hypothetical protein
MTDPYNVRKENFDYWLNEFSASYSQHISTGNILEYDENSSITLNTTYWNLREDMKDFMFKPEKKINCFKVIAGVQSIILYFQPFISPITSKDLYVKKGIKRINADFAWTVSTKILFSFNELEFSDYHDSIELFFSTKEYIDLREFHLTWCERIDNSDKNFNSYFLLAQFWQTFYNWLIEFLKNNHQVQTRSGVMA